MSSIWALYVLKIDLIENYYEVKQFAVDKLGKQQPMFITSTENIDDPDVKNFILSLDEKFKNISNKYEISLNQLEQNIQKSQAELMTQFKLVGQNDTSFYEQQPENSEDDFDFSGFIS
jgi:hypothetical protein